PAVPRRPRPLGRRRQAAAENLVLQTLRALVRASRRHTGGPPDHHPHQHSHPGARARGTAGPLVADARRHRLPIMDGLMIPEHEILPYQCSPLPPGPWLVLAPHPDDETFGMGGSLLRAKNEGIETEV